MYVTFDQIADSARVWIYQSNRILSEAEIAHIEKEAQAFLNEWTAHGATLHASARVLHKQFLAIALDEGINQASGCSIDSSVAFVKQLEQTFGNSFFDRTQVAFLLEGEVNITSLSEVKEKIKGGSIGEDTLTFNNLITSKQDLEAQWITPVKETWLKRYFQESN